MKFSITLLILFLTIQGFSQKSFILDVGDGNITSDETVSEVQPLYEFYYQSVGIVDRLINGKEYIPYYFRSKLKPLLNYGMTRTASIILGGRTYNGLSIQYDTYLDELIYTDTTRIYNNIVYQIALNKDPIDGFNLYFGSDSLFFRNFSKSKDKNFTLEEGFYEVVYNGKSKYIIRHKSAAIEKDGVEEYYYKPAGFVMIRDNYARIRSSSGFLKLLGGKSEEVKKFMRNNGIKISKADKKQIAGVLYYYDNLNTP